MNQKITSGAARGMEGLWFFDDCAYAAVGDGAQALVPDQDGIYWWQGEGYYLNSHGRETPFSQGRPRMRPGERLQRTGESWVLTEGRAPEEEKALLIEFLREVAQRFYDTLGGYEGWLAMSGMFAYAAAPEIFEEFGLFPGLWCHGQMESGKTKVCEWLMHLWGFRVSAGIGLLKGTPVGLLCECENYSNLPLWADEYRQGKVSEDKEAILRDSYNRQPPVKWTADQKQRKMKTSFLVSGESTSSDAALRSRFAHIQVSAAKRLGNHLTWMDAHKGRFFVLGRHLLEHRRIFVEELRKGLKAWTAAPEMAGVNEREKMVHGIYWAAWMAMQGLLAAHERDDNWAFQSFVMDHARGSAQDVTSETNINVFLTDLLAAFKAEAVPLSCFRHDYEHFPYPPERPNQNGGWKSYSLYIDPEQTIAALKMFLAKQREQITLRRKDLRDQLSKMPFWIEGPITKRFGPRGDTSTTKAWGFALDRMGDLGYRPVTDEEYNAYLLDAETGDPRKGAFYGIIAALEEKARREAD